VSLHYLVKYQCL